MRRHPSIWIFMNNLEFGGLGRVTINLSGALADLGYNVTVIVRNPGGEFWSSFAPKVEVMALKFPGRILGCIEMASLLRKRRPDILIANSVEALISLLARVASRSSPKVVVTQHGPFLRGVMPPLKSLKLFVYRTILRTADSFVAVSAGVAADMARVFKLEPARIRMIYNPTIQADRGTAIAEPVQHPFFNVGGPPVFVGVGRFVEQKDFKTLLDAFYLYRKQMDGRLLLIGDGPLRADLMAQSVALNLQHVVDFPGYVADPVPYMRHATALVCSSIYAGLEVVLVEALATGTPVISTDCDYGSAELLEEGRCGILVPVGDSGAMARAMIAIATDTADTATMLRTFDENRASDFFVEVASGHYAKLMDQLLETIHE